MIYIIGGIIVLVILMQVNNGWKWNELNEGIPYNNTIVFFIWMLIVVLRSRE